jgi:hypothetical protein
MHFFAGDRLDAGYGPGRVSISNYHSCDVTKILSLYGWVEESVSTMTSELMAKDGFSGR